MVRGDIVIASSHFTEHRIDQISNLFVRGRASPRHRARHRFSSVAAPRGRSGARASRVAKLGHRARGTDRSAGGPADRLAGQRVFPIEPPAARRPGLAERVSCWPATKRPAAPMSRRWMRDRKRGLFGLVRRPAIAPTCRQRFSRPRSSSCPRPSPGLRQGRCRGAGDGECRCRLLDPARAVPETVLAPPDVEAAARTGWRVAPGDARALATAVIEALALGATRAG